jgi:hypothetical protein
MRKHLQYASYIWRHKWYVFLACCRAGIWWRGLLHDLSKLRPSEWRPYAEYFNGGPHRPWREVQAWEKYEHYDAAWRTCEEGVQAAFDRAWLEHIHRNPHHPQYWVLREDSGEVKCLPMPYPYLLEMICDWRGAGMAQHNPDDTATWYLKNRDRIPFHPDTRATVERLLGVAEEDECAGS